MNMMTKIRASTTMTSAISKWEGALAETESLRAELAAMHEAGADEQTFGPVDERYRASFERLAALTPPDGSGLAKKVDIAAEIYEGFSFPEEMLGKFASDARSLTTDTALPMSPEERSTPSLIMSLHARYEAGWREYNHIDETQPKKPEHGRDPNWHPYYRAEKGMLENFQETSLLRKTICHQIPDTDEELTVLAFHVWGIFDAGEMTEDEQQALEQGINSIFDYLVSEGRADMEKMGEQFSDGATLAWHRRRYRTGLTADD